MIGDGGENVTTVPIVYPRGAVSVSSFGYFSSVGSSSKPSHPFFLSLSYQNTFKIISRIRGGGEKILKPQQEKYRHEERMK